MSEHTAPKLAAALLYTQHDPLNFKHLATLLNLILEPAKIRFRVIHERPGRAAVLSCRKLHIALEAQSAAETSAFLADATNASSLPEPLRTKLKAHARTIVLSVGTGPLPHGAPHDDRSAANLLPLVGQMVVNHLLNMHPADAVYWGETNKLMSPKAFLAEINGPLEGAPEPAKIEHPKPPRPPRTPKVTAKDRDLLRHEVLEKKRREAASRTPASTRLYPSMIATQMIPDETGSDFELSGHLRRRFETAKDGPKAAFVLSAATMIVAPLIGVLLLVYNFMGGARLRQTALLACLTAVVTLAAELTTQSGANATVTTPALHSDMPQVAHL